jgi:hypothetical protein
MMNSENLMGGNESVAFVAGGSARTVVNAAVASQPASHSHGHPCRQPELRVCTTREILAQDRRAVKPPSTTTPELLWSFGVWILEFSP